MMLSVMVKLETSDSDFQVLLKTMHQFNAACNDIANTAFELHSANKIKLQKIVYYPIKEKYGLSAQMTIRAIAKVADSYSLNKSTKPTFKPEGAVVYDQRNLSWKGLDRISITTLNGRLKIPVKIGDYRELDHARVRGQADLLLRSGKFFVSVVVDIPNIPISTPLTDKIIGVDMGIVNIAVDSAGESFSGEQIDRVREKTATIRAALQKAGTKSAKRHLKKIGKRESRFHRDVNHQISKKIVAKAKDTESMIAVEDLTGITKKTRKTVRKSQRSRHNSWSFYQLRDFIEYKAMMAGIPVIGTYAGYTSQECPKCHNVSKLNRPTRDKFACVSCGFSAPADNVAALNIRDRVAVNLPIVSGFIMHNLIHQVQTHDFSRELV